MQRDYSLTTQWTVTLPGDPDPIGLVLIVEGGYQAQLVSGDPLYPHLTPAEQHGIAHGDVDGAARELVAWARSHGDHPTERLYPVALEAVS